MEIKSNVKQRPHWAPGDKCQCKQKARYVQPEIAKSFKPNSVYRPTDVPLSVDTVYKKSYQNFDVHSIRKNIPVVPKDSLMSAGDFSSDTINKLSYAAWKGYKKPDKFLPKDHCLMGVGPMQELTTNRHDYTPKPLDKLELGLKRTSCIGLSDKPIDTRTTNSLSYIWPDNFEPSNSFKPEKRYIPPKSKIEDKTVNKMSYLPWESVKKQKYPWQEKPKYKSPSVPLLGETIYNNSYYAPGRYIDNDAPKGCYCCYTEECFDSEGNPPKAHEYSICPIGFDPKKQTVAT